MVTAKEYFFMDEEQQKPLLQQCASYLLPIVGGQIKWRDGGDELHVTGHFNQRPTRMILSVAFGTIELQLKASREFNFDTTFYVHVDAEAAKQGESGERDEWDEADNSEQRFMLAPNVYFEGDPKELNDLRGMLGRLPQEGQAALIGTLAQFDCGSFIVSGDLLKLSCPASVTLAPNSAQFVGYYLNMLFLLCAAMEQAWR